MIAAALNTRLLSCLAAAVCGWASAAAAEVPQDILAGLGSEKFAERQAAEARLLEWASGEQAAVDETFRLSQEEPDPEVRARCRDVLRKVAMNDFQLTGVGYLGVQMDLAAAQIALPDGRLAVGIRLMLVQPDTPAQRAGIEVGDVLLGIDKRTWVAGDDSRAVSEVIKTYKPGTKVTVRLLRKNEVLELPVVLAKRPNSADFIGAALLGGGQAELDRMAEDLDKKEEDAFFRRWMEKKKKKAP